MTPTEQRLLELTGLPETGLPQPADVWPADAEFLLLLANEVMAAKPKLIVDIGSGYTTLIAAACCEILQRGRVISLEHVEQYRATTIKRLAEHRLLHRALVLFAPLEEVEIDATQYRWYRRPVVDEAIQKPIDVLIVDGPPGRDSSMARYSVGHVLFSRLNHPAIVLVDDAERRDEKEMLRRFSHEFPYLTQERLPTAKANGGAAILRQQ